MPDARGSGATDVREESGAGWSAYSRQGQGRTRNADAWAVRINGARMGVAVADGVGVLPASPVASAAAAHAAVGWVSERGTGSSEDAGGLLAAANQAVSDALRGDSSSGATTLVSASLVDGCGVLATIGDSEVLAIGMDGPAERLNELDHVPSAPNVLLSWIDGALASEPHVLELFVLPYRLCFVTDGVSSALDYQRIADVVRSVPVTAAARALVEAARAAGAQDDVTAVVISGDRERVNG